MQVTRRLVLFLDVSEYIGKKTDIFLAVFVFVLFCKKGKKENFAVSSKKIHNFLFLYMK